MSEIEIRNYLKHSFDSDIARDVLYGLTSPKKKIPSKYFYDARGSRLFDRICGLPEYYPTRTEISILKESAPEIMDGLRDADMVELGSGANRKIRTLLDSVSLDSRKKLRYLPVDVSKEALIEAAEELKAFYPELEVLGIVADFTRHMESIPAERRRLIIFLGSTIGNFEDKQCSVFLNRISRSMNPDDRLLVGFDMIKNRSMLEAAYNDESGVTAEFNRNILNVLNRSLDADFKPAMFRHIAFFNEERKRVEMHLRAKKRMKVEIKALDLTIHVDEGEFIHTETCRKFSRYSVEDAAGLAGLKVKRWFSDKNRWFTLAELVLK